MRIHLLLICALLSYLSLESSQNDLKSTVEVSTVSIGLKKSASDSQLKSRNATIKRAIKKVPNPVKPNLREIQLSPPIKTKQVKEPGLCELIIKCCCGESQLEDDDDYYSPTVHDTDRLLDSDYSPMIPDEQTINE